MRSGWSKVGQVAGRLIVLTSFLICPASVFAHKLYVFAELEGATIHGRAYFPGDIPAQKSSIIARDASGRELGRTMTDDEGKFTFTAHEHIDYYLVAETPDGHGGQYIVHASELPDRLPAKVSTTDRRLPPTAQAKGQAGVLAVAASGENELPSIGAQLADLRKQIQALRRQIYESDERLRFRDILGGIGFILGLAGLAFYLKARRSRAMHA